ncbi:MAG: helix-hairpin-helix domain-containing protein, partial [Calditrichia bacterium]
MIKKFYTIVLIVTLMLLLPFTRGYTQNSETPYSLDNQLDINNASFEEISRLPVSTEVAERIYHRILYGGPLKSIYELRRIEGIDQKLFLKLKPLIRIEPFAPKSEREERIEQLYYKLDRWSSVEGINQALIDLWIEQSLEPVDINTIRYDQLVNLQGVSPVDAAAIVSYRKQ